MPTYNKPEPPKKEEEEPVAKKEEQEEKVPDVQVLDAQKEELSSLQKEGEKPKEEEKKEEPVAVKEEEVKEDVKVEAPVEKEPEPVVAEAPKQVEKATEEPPAPVPTAAAAAGGERHEGTVEWFSVIKGYGFLKPAREGEENVFVHHSGIHMEGFRKLRQGQPVSFVVETDPSTGKTKAVDVTIHGKE